jgi:hypothetical protein
LKTGTFIVAKKIEDYSATLFSVSALFMMPEDVGVKPYEIGIKAHLAKPTKNGFIFIDGKTKKHKDLMVVKNDQISDIPCFELCCLEDDVERRSLILSGFGFRWPIHSFSR